MWLLSTFKQMAEELQKYTDILRREREELKKQLGESSEYLWIPFN